FLFHGLRVGAILLTHLVCTPARLDTPGGRRVHTDCTRGSTTFSRICSPPALLPRGNRGEMSGRLVGRSDSDAQGLPQRYAARSAWSLSGSWPSRNSAMRRNSRVCGTSSRALDGSAGEGSTPRAVRWRVSQVRIAGTVITDTKRHVPTPSVSTRPRL